MKDKQDGYTSQVLFLCTPTQKAQLAANAKAAGLGIGAYIRGILFTGKVHTKDTAKELHQLTTELNRIGSTINQYARRANQSQGVSDEAVHELIEMLSYLTQECAKLRKDVAKK